MVIGVSCQSLETNGLIKISRPTLPKFIIEDTWGINSCACNTKAVCLSEQEFMELTRFLIETNYAFEKWEAQID